MKIIGLTGNSGSGKSTVSEILKKLGAYVIDADMVSHDAILCGKPSYNEIISFFGTSVLRPDGEIDRKKLGSIVFSDQCKLKELEKITHKYIKAEILDLIKSIRTKNSFSTLVIDAPLLIEAGLLEYSDFVWVVACDSDICINRIIKRDSISLEDAKRRLNSQRSIEDFKKYAHVILYNNGSVIDLEQEVQKYLSSLQL